MLIKKGTHLAYIASQLGHADITMVQKHYGHLAPSDMAMAIRAARPFAGIVGNDRLAKIEPLRIKRTV